MERSIILKSLKHSSLPFSFAMKERNLSPSIHAMGADEILINSFATVLLPAPGGPERMMSGFIVSGDEDFVLLILFSVTA
jgi:hypothetical protein